MTVLQLTPHARARLFSDIAGMTFPAVGELRRNRYPHAGTAHPTCRRWLVEAYVPRGARADYGLLGLEFAPGPAAIEVIVPYSGPHGATLTDSLAGQIDDVRVGLPEEYAEAVLDALCAAAVSLPSGVLRVCAAAHGRVGSSPKFFARLAAAVVSLMSEGDEDARQATITLRGLLV